MKVERVERVDPTDRIEGSARIEHKGRDKLRDEIEPQKTEREFHERQIRPRDDVHESGMDVTA